MKDQEQPGNTSADNHLTPPEKPPRFQRRRSNSDPTSLLTFRAITPALDGRDDGSGEIHHDSSRSRPRTAASELRAHRHASRSRSRSRRSRSPRRYHSTSHLSPERRINLSPRTDGIELLHPRRSSVSSRRSSLGFPAPYFSRPHGSRPGSRRGSVASRPGSVAGSRQNSFSSRRHSDSMSSRRSSIPDSPNSVPDVRDKKWSVVIDSVHSESVSSKHGSQVPILQDKNVSASNISLSDRAKIDMQAGGGGQNAEDGGNVDEGLMDVDNDDKPKKMSSFDLIAKASTYMSESKFGGSDFEPDEDPDLLIEEFWRVASKGSVSGNEGVSGWYLNISRQLDVNIMDPLDTEKAELTIFYVLHCLREGAEGTEMLFRDKDIQSALATITSDIKDRGEGFDVLGHFLQRIFNDLLEHCTAAERYHHAVHVTKILEAWDHVPDGGCSKVLKDLQDFIGAMFFWPAVYLIGLLKAFRSNIWHRQFCDFLRNFVILIGWFIALGFYYMPFTVAIVYYFRCFDDVIVETLAPENVKQCHIKYGEVLTPIILQQMTIYYIKYIERLDADEYLEDKLDGLWVRKAKQLMARFHFFEYKRGEYIDLTVDEYNEPLMKKISFMEQVEKGDLRVRHYVSILVSLLIAAGHSLIPGLHRIYVGGHVDFLGDRSREQKFIIIASLLTNFCLFYFFIQTLIDIIICFNFQRKSLKRLADLTSGKSASKYNLPSMEREFPGYRHGYIDLARKKQNLAAWTEARNQLKSARPIKKLQVMVGPAFIYIVGLSILFLIWFLLLKIPVDSFVIMCVFDVVIVFFLLYASIVNVAESNTISSQTHLKILYEAIKQLKEHHYYEQMMEMKMSEIKYKDTPNRGNHKRLEKDKRENEFHVHLTALESAANELQNFDEQIKFLGAPVNRALLIQLSASAVVGMASFTAAVMNLTD